MKIYNKRMYSSHVNLSDIIDYLQEVEAQVETLEVLNEELEKENEQLRDEITKIKSVREEKIA